MTSYEQYISQLIERCLDLRNTPWSQTFGPWLYDQIGKGSRDHGVPRSQIYDELLAKCRKGVFPYHINVVSKRTSIANLRYYKYITLGWIFDSLQQRLRSKRTTDSPIAYPNEVNHHKRASIVSLSFNRLEYLQTSLDYFFKSIQAACYELIVVDNGSTDGSAEYLVDLAHAGKITKLILRKKNHGISPGFNCGFAYADPNTDFLIKLDSDINILNPGWFDHFVRIFDENSNIGTLALNIKNHPNLLILPAEQHNGHALINWTHWMSGGACMTIPRSIFDQVGYFNESFDFTYMPDDVDYYWRLCMLGYNAYYTQQFTSWHRFDLDMTKYRRYQSAKIKQFFKKILKARKQLAREYLCDQRSPIIKYAKYKNCVFPKDTNILEIS